MSNQRRMSVKKGHLWGRRLDFFLTSGISLLVLTCTLSLSHLFEGNISPSLMVSGIFILQLLTNWPHFIISYKLLYWQKQCFRQYPGATLYIPFALLITILAILIIPSIHADSQQVALLSAYLLWIIASLYLAWHYVGQAWGCFITFLILDQHQLSEPSKRGLYFCYRVLIAWHVMWALQTLPPLPIVKLLQAQWLIDTINILGLASLIISTLILYRSKAFKYSNYRALGVWFSTYAWYLAIYINPNAIVLVQLAHALQYLTFALRSELNQLNTNNHEHPKLSLGVSYLFAVIIGAIVFAQADSAANLNSAVPTFIGLLAIAINIHHYYVDSCIWKLRSNSTQQRLFAHLGR